MPASHTKPKRPKKNQYFTIPLPVSMYSPDNTPVRYICAMPGVLSDLVAQTIEGTGTGAQLQHDSVEGSVIYDVLLDGTGYGQRNVEIDVAEGDTLILLPTAGIIGILFGFVYNLEQPMLHRFGTTE